MAKRKPKPIPEHEGAEKTPLGDGGTLVEWKNERGRLHRENAPAQLVYDDMGRRLRETYFVDGAIHREGGPAHIVYDRRGRVIARDYWMEGRKCDHDPLHRLVKHARENTTTVEF